MWAPPPGHGLAASMQAAHASPQPIDRIHRQHPSGEGATSRGAALTRETMFAPVTGAPPVCASVDDGAASTIRAYSSATAPWPVPAGPDNVASALPAGCAAMTLPQAPPRPLTPEMELTLLDGGQVRAVPREPPAQAAKRPRSNGGFDLDAVASCSPAPPAHRAAPHDGPGRPPAILCGGSRALPRQGVCTPRPGHGCWALGAAGSALSVTFDAGHGLPPDVPTAPCADAVPFGQRLPPAEATRARSTGNPAHDARGLMMAPPRPAAARGAHLAYTTAEQDAYARGVLDGRLDGRGLFLSAAAAVPPPRHPRVAAPEPHAAGPPWVGQSPRGYADQRGAGWAHVPMPPSAGPPPYPPHEAGHQASISGLLAEPAAVVDAPPGHTGPYETCPPPPPLPPAWPAHAALAPAFLAAVPLPAGWAASSRDVAGSETSSDLQPQGHQHPPLPHQPLFTTRPSAMHAPPTRRSGAASLPALLRADNESRSTSQYGGCDADAHADPAWWPIGAEAREGGVRGGGIGLTAWRDDVADELSGANEPCADDVLRACRRGAPAPLPITCALLHAMGERLAFKLECVRARARARLAGLCHHLRAARLRPAGARMGAGRIAWRAAPRFAASPRPRHLRRAPA